MRLITSLLVVVLLTVSVAVFANGRYEAPPSETPSMEQPSGMGPEEGSFETTTPSMPPSMTMPSTSTMPHAVMMATSSEVETFNTNHVVTTFGVDRGSVMQLRAAGWSWGDIYLMSNIAMKSRRSVLDVASLRSQNMAWIDIANRYNLTALDITNAPVVTTRVAGYVTEYGYQPIYYKTDPWGNPVLTKYEADRLSRMGYRWQDIAVAANISAKTGASVVDVLAWTDRGYTWNQVAREYGLDPKTVMNVSQYPFVRTGVAPTAVPSGAGPMYTYPNESTVTPGATVPVY